MRATILAALIGCMCSAAALAAAPLPAALAILPSEALARQAVQEHPQLRAGVLGVDLAEAGKRRLDAGQYEWTVRTGASRHRDEFGNRYAEQELALERGLRWFGKAGGDNALGAKGVELAKAGHADVWHETSRALMTDWFDAVREMSAVRRMREQRELAGQLRAIVDKRVRAGDAAPLELLQADTESRRVDALLQQARQREERALQILSANYPGLPRPDVAAMPSPQPLSDDAAHWFDIIMHDNHELELAQAELDLSTLQAARVARERMPDPTIGVHARRERGGLENIVGLSISIPLPGQARAADGSAAAARAGMAAERLRQTQTRVTLAARRAIDDCGRNYANWQTLQDVRQQSERQAATMMSAYRLGEASLGDALNTRRLALDAAAMAESAQIDALAALSRLYLDAHVIWALD